MGVLVAALICLATCGGGVAIGALHQHKAERYAQVHDSISSITVKLTVKGARKCFMPLVKETLEKCSGVKSVKYKRRTYYIETDSTFNLNEAQQQVLEYNVPQV